MGNIGRNEATSFEEMEEAVNEGKNPPQTEEVKVEKNESTE